jgi:hypothetical protein
METGLKKKIVYKCINCPTILNNPEQMIGRTSICWGVCGGVAKYTREDYMQNLKFPICDECREERKKQRELLKSIS